MEREVPDYERRPFRHLPEVHRPKVQVPAGLVKGQTAIVTGSSRGIGRACALALAQAGANVVITYRSKEEKAKAVAEEVRAAGGEAIVVKGDVSSEVDVRAMFMSAVEEFGRIDILVSNAGMEKQSPIEEITLEDWNKVIGVNLTGSFLCAREAIRLFRKQGIDTDVSVASGKIIFTSSVHDIIPWNGFASYVAAKGGLLMLMKSMALEVARQRIRVNAVSPGAIRTDINKEAWDEEHEYLALMDKVPYNRVGEVMDVGRTVAWLASDQADYITGVTLYVDGGMTLYPSFETGG